MDSDEALARKLQAQFDIENTRPHQAPSAASNAPVSLPKQAAVEDDEALARKLQDEYDNENQEHIYQPQAAGAAFSHSVRDQASQADVPSLASTVRGIAPPSNSFTQATSEPQLQAEEVQNTVRKLIQPHIKLKCKNCKKHFWKSESDLSTLSKHIQKSASHIANGNTVPCPSCGASQEHEQARLLLTWTLLCDFDAKSKFNKPDKKRSRKVKSTGNGIGYGGKSKFVNYDTFSTDGEDWFNPSYGRPRSLQPPLRDNPPATSKRPLDEDDTMTVNVLTSLRRILPSFERESQFDIDPPARELQSLFLCSSVLERAADLLRNNDLENVASRSELYEALAKLLQDVASLPGTSSLVFGERVVRSPGVSIFKVSQGKSDLSNTDETDTTQPLAFCMRELAAQCSIMLKSNTAGSEDLQLFRTFKSLNDFFVANGGQKTQVATGKNAWHKELSVSEVADEAIVSSHSLAGKTAVTTSAPGRMKRIMQEIARLEAGLPNGIFIRYAESQPHIMKAIIVGPEDTPYENGLFEFDILCDASFPNGPPKVDFRTTGGGRVGFNPNLYADGKVCLSLLGTWSGEPWDPKQSTLLQVLVSVQAMIFCDNPWQNEPGRENIPNSEEHNKRYNRTLYPHTIQHAMLDWLERRKHAPIRGAGRFGKRSVDETSVIDAEPSIWDEIVKRHFDDNAEDIISTVGRWVNDVGPPPTPARRSYVAPGGFNPATAGFPFGGGHGFSPSNHPSMYGAAVYPFAGDGYTLGGGNFGSAPGVNTFPHGSSPLNSNMFGAQQPSGPPVPSSGAVLGNGGYRAPQQAAPAQPPAYGTTTSASRPPSTHMPQAILTEARGRLFSGPEREEQTSNQGGTNKAFSTTLTGDNLVQKLRDAIQKLKRNSGGFMH
ncbi:putative ubiquitin-conjugating enzyme protein 17 [Pseudocercospora fuligena]|uniref:Putative ubiquitin-conjugating enzyme protein 17 n=1 Tax=Pseudocercospora fuligena TaxID=685502 RepID=A0A8H6R943_9PEZI|nr:putative ubiquitin-conjugating enzyme protein 17 [Pseudocercospora fuligena]